MAKVFLDLDGVGADFDEFIDTLYPNLRKVSDEEFWAELSNIPNFFSQLQPILDFGRVIRACLHHDLEWLTAIPKPTKYLCTAANDKRAFVAKHFPSTIPVSTVSGGRNKAQWLHVYPGAVLIDDYPRNINMWSDAGGIGILHTSVDDTLVQLKQRGLIY